MLRVFFIDYNLITMLNQTLRGSILFIIIICLTTSCSIQRNLLFQSDTSINTEAFDKTLMSAQKNYLIQKGDYLAVSIFPNKGEQIVDQTMDFPIGTTPQGGSQRQVNAGQQLNKENGNDILSMPLRQNNSQPNSYLVEEDGTINLPQIGKVQLDQKTLREASDLIASKYVKFIKDPYVIMQYLNKRVIVMGALGDQVITLRNENMSLYEVLALASSNEVGGQNVSIQNNAKTRTIRLIRNYTTDPSVLIIDLTTIEGVQQLNTNIQPNDIIYIEPRRKFDRDTLTDVSAVLSPIASIIALIVAINAL